MTRTTTRPTLKRQLPARGGKHVRPAAAPAAPAAVLEEEPIGTELAVIPEAVDPLRATREAWYGDEQWRSVAGDVVDAEIEEDSRLRTFADAASRKLRRSFSPAAERAARRHDERIELDLERSAASEQGPQSRNDALLTLRSEIRLNEDAYLGWVSRTNLRGKRGLKKMDAMQAIYNRHMLHSITKPLTQEVDAASVVQVAGTMATLALLSPSFRAEVGQHVEPLKKAVLGQMETFAAYRADHYRSLQINGSDAGRAKQKQEMWERRHERIQFHQRGDRELLDARSAALTEVGLMRNTFHRLREPGADRKAVMDDYTMMRSALREHAAEDGIPFDLVTSETRKIVGDAMEHDPEMRVMFEGISHGRLVKGHMKPVRLTGTQFERMVWDGDFETHLGTTLQKDAGRFVVRQPMSAEEHQARITDTMVTAMGKGLREGNYDRFGAAAAGYMVGYGAAGKRIEIPEDLPEDFRDRLRDAETIKGAMAVDGLDADEIALTYSLAYADAIEQLGAGGYDMEEEFAKTFGPTWKERLGEAGADPLPFFREERERRRAREAVQDFSQRPGFYADAAGTASRTPETDYQAS